MTKQEKIDFLKSELADNDKRRHLILSLMFLSIDNITEEQLDQMLAILSAYVPPGQ